MRIVKWILGILILLFFAGFVYIKMTNETLPQGQKGAAADALAQEMLSALNKPAWDELRYVQWTFFRGKHHYQWDKQQNHAIIKWDDIEVVMALNEVQGSVRKGGQALSGEEKQEHINTAWNYWCNDSFWLIAPYKVFDPGVERSVINEDRKKGLLVQYQSGGVTPGDAYLWWLDETNKPTSWQMWTSILPMQGIENSWEGWKTLPGGAMVSTVHDGLPMKAEMSNVNAGMSPSDIGLASADAFRILAD